MTTQRTDHGQDFDDRLFRTELIRTTTTDTAWNEQVGWSLYIDGTHVAHIDSLLPVPDAHAWANAHLGEGMTWLPGHPDNDFYWVSSPTQRR